MRTSLRRVRHCRQVDSSLVARADLPRNMCALMSAVQTDLRHIDPKIRRRVGSKTQRSTQLKNRGPALRMPPAAMIFIISAVRSLPLLPALPHYLACFGGLIAEMPESGSGVGHKLGCGSQMRSPASAMIFSSISTSSRTPVSRSMTSAVDSMKDGLRSITLAARKAPSVGLALLVAGVIRRCCACLIRKARARIFPTAALFFLGRLREEDSVANFGAGILIG
jgi:hypothetical protein